MDSIISLLRRISSFYFQGFANMPDWGRKVWIIIIIKLFIILVVLKLFFFRDFLGKKYDNDKQKSEYVLDQLIKSPSAHD
jgi:hypothetical protein